MSIREFFVGARESLDMLADEKGFAYVAFVFAMLGIGPLLIYFEDPQLFLDLPVSKLLLLSCPITAVPMLAIIQLFLIIESPKGRDHLVRMGAVAGTAAIITSAICAVALRGVMHQEFGVVSVYAVLLLALYVLLAIALKLVARSNSNEAEKGSE